MANFKESLDIVFKLEYSSPKNALHTNPGEDGYTFCGVYEKANPNWAAWPKIKEVIKEIQGDGELTKNVIQQASEKLYRNSEIMLLVEYVYESKYWNPFRLSELNQTAADEIFVFGVNVGMRTAIRKAQKVVGTTQDGIIGPITIAAINAFPEEDFDMLFDEEEIKYYDKLIERNPSFAVFRNGWHNRARAV